MIFITFTYAEEIKLFGISEVDFSNFFQWELLAVFT